jgi:hypothetical protein
MTIVNDSGNEVLRKAAVVIDPTSYALRIGYGMVPPSYDQVVVTYPSSISEVFTFKLSAATIGVITLVYTDSTKEFLSTATRT